MRFFTSGGIDSVTVEPSPLPLAVAPARVVLPPVLLSRYTDAAVVPGASMRSLNANDTASRARSTEGAEPGASVGLVVSSTTSIALLCTAANRLPATSAVIP